MAVCFDTKKKKKIKRKSLSWDFLCAVAITAAATVVT